MVREVKELFIYERTPFDLCIMLHYTPIISSIKEIDRRVAIRNSNQELKDYFGKRFFIYQIFLQPEFEEVNQV